MSRTSPLHAVVSNLSPEVKEYGDWRVPWTFRGLSEEYEAARCHAAVFDTSYRTRVEITGGDRVEFLHNFVTNDVLHLADGGGCEAFLTTAQAHIIAWILIYRCGDRLWLEADASLGTKIRDHLEHYVITEDVTICDRSDETAEAWVTGPEAGRLLSEVLGGGFVDASDARPLAAIQAGSLMILTDARRFHQPGFALVGSPDEVASTWQKLVSAGVVPAGQLCYETLRVESGTPSYGIDITENNLPQEIGRDEQTLCFTKGCFLGQEPIVRIRDIGHVNRRLGGLLLEGGEPVATGSKVIRGDDEIGRVTSSVYSPAKGRAIALAFLRRGHQEPGTAVEVEEGAGRRSAQVSSLPFATGRTASSSSR